MTAPRGRLCQFEVAPPDPVLGSKLTVTLGRQAPKVRLRYRTVPEASGLQWLTPAMTLGKKTPFMFSQSQQIHARSWVPLQDTTLVRFTYDAHITSPKDAMVLMSADNDPAAVRDGDYTFRMPQRIPSYLLAIAAGDLVFRPITDRAGVWAEPAMAAKAAAEFADTGRMMEATEQLYGPYRWDRYDILVLPPSFPYGGMENPRLTFATPTVITGDKSLVSLIAHELAHSWSGNLVTFATARDAWLNEGPTSYVENRVIEALYGKARADMEKVIVRNELKVEFTPANVALQPLAVKPGVLKDPDDNLTSTIYTKGAWFMQFLEERVGRAEFDAFLRAYFDHFAFQSVSTAQFAEYARANLLETYPGKVSAAEFDAWLYEPGVPSTAPQTTAARFDAVDAGRKAWLESGTIVPAAVTKQWTTQEWVHFIDGMPSTLDRGPNRGTGRGLHSHWNAERRNRAALVSADHPQRLRGRAPGDRRLSVAHRPTETGDAHLPRAGRDPRRFALCARCVRQREARPASDYHRLGRGRLGRQADNSVGG